MPCPHRKNKPKSGLDKLVKKKPAASSKKRKRG
jgi:hypothetical protein